jgi:hypothetical protein
MARPLRRRGPGHDGERVTSRRQVPLVSRGFCRDYDLKSICDYEPRPNAVVPREIAEAAVETAARFVDCVATLLATN